MTGFQKLLSFTILPENHIGASKNEYRIWTTLIRFYLDFVEFWKATSRDPNPGMSKILSGRARSSCGPQKLETFWSAAHRPEPAVQFSARVRHASERASPNAATYNFDRVFEADRRWPSHSRGWQFRSIDAADNEIRGSPLDNFRAWSEFQDESCKRNDLDIAKRLFDYITKSNNKRL